MKRGFLIAFLLFGAFLGKGYAALIPADTLKTLPDGQYFADVTFFRYPDNISAEYNLKLRVRDGIVRVLHLNNGRVVHDGINNEGYMYVGGQITVKKNKHTGKLEYTAQVTVSSAGTISTYTISIEKEASD
ncbi:MAG: hypothetical protein ACXVI9_02795 [Mucilaginibacter sp.]